MYVDVPPRKINMSPEKGSFQKEFSSSNYGFSGEISVSCACSQNLWGAESFWSRCHELGKFLGAFISWSSNVTAPPTAVALHFFWHLASSQKKTPKLRSWLLHIFALSAYCPIICPSKLRHPKFSSWTLFGTSSPPKKSCLDHWSTSGRRMKSSLGLKIQILELLYQCWFWFLPVIEWLHHDSSWFITVPGKGSLWTTLSRHHEAKGSHQSLCMMVVALQLGLKKTLWIAAKKIHSSGEKNHTQVDCTSDHENQFISISYPFPLFHSASIAQHLSIHQIPNLVLCCWPRCDKPNDKPPDQSRYLWSALDRSSPIILHVFLTAFSFSSFNEYTNDTKAYISYIYTHRI